MPRCCGRPKLVVGEPRQFAVDVRIGSVRGEAPRELRSPGGLDEPPPPRQLIRSYSWDRPADQPAELPARANYSTMHRSSFRVCSTAVAPSKDGDDGGGTTRSQRG